MKQHLKEENNLSQVGISNNSHRQLAGFHSEAGASHEIMASVKTKRGLSDDEKKILADQKKKQIEHHEKMYNFHKDVASHIALKHSGDHVNEELNRHRSLAQSHKQEKERLENEKKGY
jgi:hypothetical protein